ncbi:MAG: Lrp/AsnC family transcriptional regulator [Bacteroidetes bacterium]|nr:Lrp/AsnC family transcriptional regulator [Bacteroidota bacterium]
MNGLDATDKRILQLLQENAKLTNKEIAGKLGMSVTPIYERIKRLERGGVIKKYVAIVDKAKVGLPLVAFCNVSLKEHSQQYILRFEKEVHSLTEVIECYHVAGMFDYLIKVIIKDMEAYQYFIVHKLAALDNIGQVQSSFVLTNIKYSTIVNPEG